MKMIVEAKICQIQIIFFYHNDYVSRDVTEES